MIEPSVESGSSWRVLAGSALVAAFGVQTLWFATLGLFLRPLQHDLGWSRADIAFAITLLTFMVPVLMPAVGWLIDRVPLRPLVLASVVLQSIGIAANSRLGGSVWNLYALVAIVAVLASGASTVTLAKLIRGWFDASLGRAFGVLFACVSLGGMVVPLLAQALLERLGWRSAYVALGGVSLVVAGLAAWLAVRERPGSRTAGGYCGSPAPGSAGVPAARDAAPPAGAGDTAPIASAQAEAAAAAAAEAKAAAVAAAQPSSFVALLRLRSWWLLALWNCAFAFAVSGILFHFAAMLQDRGSTPAQSAVALSLIAGSAFAGNLAIGWLMDRMPARFLACAMMLAPLCAVLLLLASEDVRVALVAALVFGLCAGSEGSLNAFLVGRLFGLSVYGRAYSSQQVAIGLGGGFAPFMVAVLQGRSGNYTLALTVSAAAFGAAALLALLLPSTQRAVPASAARPHPVGA